MAWTLSSIKRLVFILHLCHNPMSISCRHVSVVSCQVGSWLTLTITFSYSGMRSTLQHHECLSVGVQLSAVRQLDISLFDDINIPFSTTVLPSSFKEQPNSLSSLWCLKGLVHATSLASDSAYEAHSWLCGCIRCLVGALSKPLFDRSHYA